MFTFEPNPNSLSGYFVGGDVYSSPYCKKLIPTMHGFGSLIMEYIFNYLKTEFDDDGVLPEFEDIFGHP
jgi:hypothetical protein